MSKNAEYETYKRIKLLGEGSFGKAYLVQCLSDGSYCVIKQVDLGKMSEKEKKETFMEAKVLEAFNHPNIVKFREVYKTKKGKLCIVMDYADGGDLTKKLKSQRDYFPEAQVLDWFTQMTLALKHVHDRKILHRDLKCQNIFLTKTNIIKLGDFGIARVLSNTRENAKTMVGTPYYLSPEIVNGKPYSFKSDIWSLGVVLYELCAKRPPFDAPSLPLLAMKIAKGQYSSIPSVFSKDMRNLISSLLQVDPSRRPNTATILKMPIIVNRIKNFLSDSVRLKEFSHTIIHNKKFVDKNINMMDIKNVQNEAPMPEHMIKKLREEEKNLPKEQQRPPLPGNNVKPAPKQEVKPVQYNPPKQQDPSPGIARNNSKENNNAKNYANNPSPNNYGNNPNLNQPKPNYHYRNQQPAGMPSEISKPYSGPKISEVGARDRPVSGADQKQQQQQAKPNSPWQYNDPSRNAPNKQKDPYNGKYKDANGQLHRVYSDQVVGDKKYDAQRKDRQKDILDDYNWLDKKKPEPQAKNNNYVVGNAQRGEELNRNKWVNRPMENPQPQHDMIPKQRDLVSQQIQRHHSEPQNQYDYNQPVSAQQNYRKDYKKQAEAAGGGGLIVVDFKDNKNYNKNNFKPVPKKTPSAGSQPSSQPKKSEQISAQQKMKEDKKKYDEEKAKKEKMQRDEQKRKEEFEQQRAEKEKKVESDRQKMWDDIKNKREQAKKNQGSNFDVELFVDENSRAAKKRKQLEQENQNDSNKSDEAKSEPKSDKVEKKRDPFDVDVLALQKKPSKKDEKKPVEEVKKSEEKDKLELLRQKSSESNKKEDSPQDGKKEKRENKWLAHMNEMQDEIERMQAKVNHNQILNKYEDDDLRAFNGLVDELYKILNDPVAEDEDNDNANEKGSEMDQATTNDTDDNNEEDRDDDNEDEEDIQVPDIKSNEEDQDTAFIEDDKSIDVIEDPNKIKPLRNMMIDTFGMDDFLRLYKIINELLTKHGDLEEIEKIYRKKDNYASLFPFLNEKQLNKDLPLMISYCVLENLNESREKSG